MKHAYINFDAISSYNNVKGQVEIYDDILDEYEWESYPSIEEMEKAVEELNEQFKNE